MKKSIFLFFAAILCTIGLNAANFKKPYIYFNNAELNWNPAMIFVGHKSYSAGYNQTTNPVADTKLVYFYPNASWGDAEYFTIGQTKDWGAEGKNFNDRVGWMTHIGIKSNYGFNENNTYNVTGKVDSEINVEWCSG